MCTNPFELHVKNSGHFHGRSSSYMVPCGKCAECTKSKQLEWTVRMLEQVKDTPACIFVTLTYAPENVPISVDVSTGEVFLTVCKEDVQKWIKRMKIRLSRQGRDFSSRPLHYFLTSEYGMRPNRRGAYRPHYHALFFGITLDEFLPAIEDWRNRYGFVNYSIPRNRLGACRYTAKYCCKGSFENPLVAQGKVRPTFHLVSHGLGAGYIARMRSWHLNPADRGRKDISNNRVNLYYSKKYVEFVADNLYYHSQSYYDSARNQAFKVKLPRYYKDRILGVTVYSFSSDSKSRAKVVLPSALQNQVKDFLFQRRIEFRDRKRQQFIDQGLASSFGEADLLLLESERISLLERKKVAEESLLHFFNKSKL